MSGPVYSQKLSDQLTGSACTCKYSMYRHTSAHKCMAKLRSLSFYSYRGHIRLAIVKAQDQTNLAWIPRNVRRPSGGVRHMSKASLQLSLVYVTRTYEYLANAMQLN